MNRQRGFTLVEVLAAMAFLGLVMPAVISALLVANRASVVAERSSIATQLGENQMAELIIGDAWSGAASGGEFSDHPGYRWELKKTDWEGGSMTELDLTIFFKVQGQEHSVQLSSLVNDSVSSTPSTGTSTTQ